jgi:hypothetical protein
MASVTDMRNMAGVLVDLYMELKDIEDKSDFQQEQFNRIYTCLIEVGVLKPCSACENIFFRTDLTTRKKCCDRISYFCKKCLKRHDRQCDVFNENLEKFQEEKLEKLIEGEKTTTRVSAGKAKDSGLIQCSCKAYFVPELKKNGKEHYKSCLRCRSKRKGSKDEEAMAKEDEEARVELNEVKKQVQKEVLRTKKEKLKEVPEPVLEAPEAKKISKKKSETARREVKTPTPAKPRLSVERAGIEPTPETAKPRLSVERAGIEPINPVHFVRTFTSKGKDVTKFLEGVRKLN